MKHCFLAKKILEAKDWLDKHYIYKHYYYTNSVPAKSTVEKWFADDARSGRPKEAVIDENIKKVHKIILIVKCS
jgi:hypothetical protein